MVKIKRIIKQWKINNGNGMLKKYLINQKKREKIHQKQGTKNEELKE